MNRLTTNKPVKEMGMYELAHNCMFKRDGEAWFRDFDREISLRNMIRAIMKEYTNYDDRMDDDELLDEELFDNLQFDPDSDIDGLIAVFNMLAWSHADLRERLKYYEDLEEDGKMLILPCKLGDTVYSYCSELDTILPYFVGQIVSDFDKENGVYFTIVASFYELDELIDCIDFEPKEVGKTIFLTEQEAQKALEVFKNER